MPVRDQSRYPGGSLRSPEWLAIRAAIIERSIDNGGERCECWGECGHEHYEWRCDAYNGRPHPVTGSRVVLTIAHLDHDPANNDPENLRALCQRCHNRLDAPMRSRNARMTRRARRAMGDLFDVTR